MRVPSTPTPTLASGRVRLRGNEPDWAERDGTTWREIALDLVESDRRGVYRGKEGGWSCNCLELYGVCAYRLEPEQTEEVLRIGRRLLELPEIDRAFCDGSLTWDQVLLLTRVAVPKHEHAWLALALDVSPEELAHAVKRSGRGWAPPVAETSSPVVGAATPDAVEGAPTTTSSSHRARPVQARAGAGAGRLSLGRRPMSRIAAERLGRGRATASWRGVRAPNVRQHLRVPRSTA